MPAQSSRPLGRIQTNIAATEAYNDDQDLWWEDRYDESRVSDERASPLCSALVRFANRHDIDGLRALLAAQPGMDPNDNGPNYEMPLHEACDVGSLECALALLAAGADPTLMDRHGITPLGYAASSEHPSSGHICQALAAAGAEIDLPDLHGLTPFLSACRRGNIPAAQALLDLGADLHARTPDRKDALDLATEARGSRHRRWAHTQHDPDGMRDWIWSLFEREEMLDEPEISQAAPARKSARSL